ncbi:MAG TPA: cytochrome c oxidase subunit II [Gaiellaceae bacterium]|nr:cytochrome c oxidase subunit II [Gaiellaceae bacterium]
MWSSWSHGRRVAVLTIVVTIILLPIMIFVLGPNMPPGKNTDVGKGQVFDNTVLLIVMTPFTAFILTYLVYAAIAFRVPDSDSREGAHIRGHMRSQIIWLVTTTAAVLFLAIFGTAELLSTGAGGGQGPKPITKPGGTVLPVQVIGQQWEFTFRYPTYGGVETAQLEIPVGTQIAFHVTSLDAIHSFWAYQLGVKADANPGVDNVAYVKPKTTRSFDIRCAELCGLWHGYMFDTGYVVTQSQFTTWIAQQQRLYAKSMKDLPPFAYTYAPDPTFRAG